MRKKNVHLHHPSSRQLSDCERFDHGNEADERENGTGQSVGYSLHFGVSGIGRGILNPAPPAARPSPFSPASTLTPPLRPPPRHPPQSVSDRCGAVAPLPLT